MTYCVIFLDRLPAQLVKHYLFVTTVINKFVIISILVIYPHTYIDIIIIRFIIIGRIFIVFIIIVLLLLLYYHPYIIIVVAFVGL